MSGYFTGFKTTAPVDAYINNNGARAHVTHHIFRHYNGRAAAGAA